MSYQKGLAWWVRNEFFVFFFFGINSCLQTKQSHRYANSLLYRFRCELWNIKSRACGCYELATDFVQLETSCGNDFDKCKQVFDPKITNANWCLFGKNRRTNVILGMSQLFIICATVTRRCECWIKVTKNNENNFIRTHTWNSINIHMTLYGSAKSVCNELSHDRKKLNLIECCECVSGVYIQMRTIS